jgi:solute:Na+ symporter, SSS family
MTNRGGTLHWIDWGVVALYIVAILWIGWRESQKGKGQSTKAYFLGGRRFSSFTIGISMFVTLFSTISYLSGPGEIIRYGPGLYWGQLICAPLVFPLIGFWLIPLLMKQPVATLYQFLETKLGPDIRTLGACMFMLYRLVWMGLLMRFAADAMSVTLGMTPAAIPWITVATGLIVITYTALGGLSGVMVAEVLQFFVLFSGVIAALVIVTLRFGGFDWFPTHWQPSWPTQPVISADLTIRLTLLGSLLRGAMLDTAHSVDQSQVQRYMASADVKQARRSLAIRMIGSNVVWAFLVMIGVALLSFYQKFPDAMPTGQTITSYADRLFPYFIAHELPVGLSGLVAAAILAAGMSGVSSAVNAFTVVIVNDFVERHGARQATDQQRKRFAVALAFVIGAVVIGFSLLVGFVPGNFVEVTSRTIQLFIPLELGIVLCAMAARFGVTPFATMWSVAYGFAIGVVTSYWQVFTGRPGISFTLYMVVILGVQMIAAGAISFVPAKRLSRGALGGVSVLLTAALAGIIAVTLRIF